MKAVRLAGGLGTMISGETHLRKVCTTPTPARVGRYEFTRRNTNLFFAEIHGGFCTVSNPSQRLGRNLRMMRPHLFLRHQYPPALHPTDRHCKQHRQSRCVLGQPFGAQLVKAELAHGQTKCVFNLDTHAGLQLLSLAQQTAPWRLPIQRQALAWKHCGMSLFSGGRGSLGRTMADGLCQGIPSLTMQKGVSLGDIDDGGGRVNSGVYQTAIRICANVPFHSEVALLNLLGLVQHRDVIIRSALAGTGRFDQYDMHYGACFNHQASAIQGGVDGRKLPVAEFVAFEKTIGPQDGALIGQTIQVVGQACRLATQNDIGKCLSRGRVRQSKSMIQEMAAQLGCYCKRRGTVLLERARGSINATNSAHGTTCFISLRNSRLRVLLVSISKPAEAQFVFLSALILCSHQNIHLSSPILKPQPMIKMNGLPKISNNTQTPLYMH